MVNKRLINTGVEAAPAVFDPLQNFETVTYTGNGGTQKITGYIRKGGAFNGSSSGILAQRSLPSGNASRSVSLWFNTTDTGTQTLLDYGAYSSNNYFRILFDTSNRINFAFFGNDFVVTPSTTFTDGNWHHLVFTYDGTTQEIFLDGISQGTRNATSTNTTASTNLSIGYAHIDTGSPRYFDGKIDQVRIFDKAISSSEVTTLYNETYASSTKSTTDIFGDGSGIALYELDEDANDTGIPIDSGQSAVFNGSSSRIQLPSGVSTATGNNDFTLSTWVYLNSMPSNFASVITTQNNFYFYIIISSDGIVRTYNQNVEVSSAAGVITTGQWYNIVATLDSTNGKNVYVNKTNVATSSNTSNCNSFTSGHNAVGYYSSSGSTFQYHLDGKIDQIRIYDTALSSSDVTNLYNESNVPTANLVAHYKLDGNATDETGSYDGTASNVTYSDPAAIAYNGTPTNVNFLGMAFQPDLVWFKQRNGTGNHALYDSIRGVGNYILSNLTNAEGYVSTSITSFDTNGFTLGSNTGENANGLNHVAWCWKAGGAAVSNTDGSITSTVSANPDAGFSIVSWTSNNNTSDSVGHGLNSTPELYIVKRRNDISQWYVLTDVIDGSTDYLSLNSTNAKSDYPYAAATSTTFNAWDWSSGSEMITYCFHSVDGYQKVGSYSGGSSGSSNVITTGFKPRFLLVKRTDAAGDAWQMFDSIRGGGDTFDNYVQANNSAAEVSYNQREVNFTDNGFYWTYAESGTNISGGTYIYLAIA